MAKKNSVIMRSFWLEPKDYITQIKKSAHACAAVRFL